MKFGEFGKIEMLLNKIKFWQYKRRNKSNRQNKLIINLKKINF